MKKVIISICLMITMVISSLAQGKGEIGVFGGASYYLGEINLSKQFYSPRSAIGPIYRYPINERYAIRGSVIFSGIQGDDKDFNSLYQQQRNRRFYTSLYDITAQFEFNFLPYTTRKKDLDKYSTYIATGGTFFIAHDALHAYQFAIPLSLGFKFNITKRMGAGFEWTFRKTFTDGLDLITGFDEIPIQNENGRIQKQSGYYNDKDWYSFGGVFLTYRFRVGGIACPAYD